MGLDPLILLPILSCALAYYSTWMMNKLQGNQPQGSAKTMGLVMPLMSLWFGFMWPAGMGVYLVATSAFQLVQEFVLHKRFEKEFAAKKAENEARETRRKQAEADIKIENQKRREEQETARKEAARAAQSKYRMKKKPGK